VNREAEGIERIRHADEFQNATCALFALVLPPLLLFADIAVRVLYSPQFSSATQFAALFVAAETITMLSGTYQSLIVASNRMFFHVTQNLIAQAILVVIALVALPRIGPEAAGWAALGSSFFMLISTWVFLRWRLHLPVGRAPLRGMLAIIAVVAITGYVGAIQTGMDIATLASRLAICLACWCALYVAMPAGVREKLRNMVGYLVRLAQRSFAKESQ
jgi:O-antigen/teichoic acid export membrane protein